MAVQVHGTCDPKFRAVKEAFAENFARRGEVGASVCAVVDERVVVDLWGGYTDETRSLPWERDTIVNVYSCTKGIAAACAHLLVERGLLDLNAPVTRYWPEFAQAGKERIPVHYLLSHRAGLPAVREPLPLGSHCRWDVMTGALARTAPWWEPGTKHGYHVMTYGWLVGEVIRRVSGKSVGAFFRDEFALPLGLDFHIGLAAEHDARTASIILAPPPRPEDPPNPMMERLKDKTSVTYFAITNPKDMMARGMANTRAWRAAEIPAANGHSNARGLARFYGALARGRPTNGAQVLRRATIEAAVVEQASGVDAVLGSPNRLAYGFMLPVAGSPWARGARLFGHPGAGGSLGFGDLDARVGFGYAMNQMQGGMGTGDPRWKPLIDGVYAAL